MSLVNAKSRDLSVNNSSTEKVNFTHRHFSHCLPSPAALEKNSRLFNSMYLLYNSEKNENSIYSLPWHSFGISAHFCHSFTRKVFLNNNSRKYWKKMLFLNFSRPHAINWKFNRFLICSVARKNIFFLPSPPSGEPCYCYCCHFTIHFYVWHNKFGDGGNVCASSGTEWKRKHEWIHRVNKKHFTSIANWYGSVA